MKIGETVSDFGTTLTRWLELVQAMVTQDFVRQFPNYPEDPPILSIDPNGKKYVRIVRKGSAYCFIDKTNGDILKAASWKAPAKGARGNIYAADPLAGVTPYGAVYR